MSLFPPLLTVVFTSSFYWHHRPNFLIFDEPTNHLDLETVEALAKAFAKFKVNCSLIPRLSPCTNAFPYCKQWKAWRGLGTRLGKLLTDTCTLGCSSQIEWVKVPGGIALCPPNFWEDSSIDYTSCVPLGH